MDCTVELPEDKRVLLKRPLGEVSDQTEFLKKASKQESIIAVGDQVSSLLIDNNIHPRLIIIDYKTKRKEINKETRETIESYLPEFSDKIENEPGIISFKSWDLIRKALDFPKARITVDGEEDLLAIPAIMLAETGTAIAYGQPDEGVVLVKVSGEIKQHVKKLLESFKKKK